MTDTKALLDALKDIAVKGSKQNIVDSGFITDPKVINNRAVFVVDLPESTSDEDAGNIQKQAEEKALSVHGIDTVTAVITRQRKKHAQEQASCPSSCESHTGSGCASHTPKQPAHGTSPGKFNLKDIKHVVAVASGKGGVGKSTTAVNLALALSQKGYAVGLLDADIYGPSVPRLLGLRNARPESKDGKTMLPPEAHNIKTMSIGFLVASDKPVAWRGPLVSGALEQFFTEVDWGKLDVLIVDLPPGTGDVQLTICQKVPLSGAVIVSTPQELALADVRKGINLFRAVDIPVLGLIENMSRYKCPQCGHEDDIFGHGGAQQAAHEMDCDFLGDIPISPKIREQSDYGNPTVAAAPQSAEAAPYKAAADKLVAKLGL